MTITATGSRLQDKIAVLFGAGGEVGTQVADEFARQGAHLFLSGRTLDHVQAVAEAIPDGKAVADVAELDALDEAAVAAYLERVVAAEGRIDVVFNAMGPQANCRRVDPSGGTRPRRAALDHVSEPDGTATEPGAVEGSAYPELVPEMERCRLYQGQS